jgi:hypothetical protein
MVGLVTIGMLIIVVLGGLAGVKAGKEASDERELAPVPVRVPSGQQRRPPRE